MLKITRSTYADLYTTSKNNVTITVGVYHDSTFKYCVCVLRNDTVVAKQWSNKRNVAFYGIREQLGIER